ncbi:xylulose kinase [Paenibacillus swuensis]|uniref:Xylulose kinase n=1 Tax=Paenibacillus swuensis TaxID=1178515 RepID=A0A172TJ93_9BACL|nr:xylulokinase [Paenibacillus swuensis]ANE47121.1 xylulose kinase [Paenibacillus swuensis]
MKYVLGIDLGTSSVKAVLVNDAGDVSAEATAAYPLIQEESGYSEQDPDEWVKGTLLAVRSVMSESGVAAERVEGMSFSGQMHGLVLLDRDRKVIRNAILWNDTRTTAQCRTIEQVLGDRLLTITRNPALEGFTLPKLLWVKEHEPELYARADVFVLPKDYLRYRLTGQIAMDLSDAAGTLLLDVGAKRWSAEICEALGVDSAVCPPLVESSDEVGTITAQVAEQTGLSPATKVFAGGADNACGAIGAGILGGEATMCSIGTSGVVLSYETDGSADYGGRVHFFNHGQKDAFYAMGVTLAAGYSLQWFRETFAPAVAFDSLLAPLGDTSPGAKGLLFTPYLAGERTPHADAVIRGSFVGMDGAHELGHFTRAVVEGITYSLRESVDILRASGKRVSSITSIGGGAKNEHWLQLQADVFGAEVVKLTTEQGPAMGAAMLAAVGCGWFGSLAECAERFIRPAKTFQPNAERQKQYDELYSVYCDVYAATRPLNERLAKFR